jgi:hypothetical protein
VHLRRALLLFAIVLGLAAIAASVSRQPEESGERAERPPPPPPTETEETPSVSPGTTPARSTDELTFNAERERSRSLDGGQPATVFVEVDQPGLVEIPDLGLSAPAEPLTPARFDVLVSDPGTYRIIFTPAAGDAAKPAGVLVVEDGGG